MLLVASNNEMFDLLNKMYSEVQGMKSDITGMKLSMTEMRDDINGRLDKLVYKVDKTNITVENDLKPKIEVLFDGHIQNAESINELTNKIDDLQSNVNYLNMRTLKNENIISNFSKILEINSSENDPL
jgi:D-lyxose ketol-isomerase